mmetsp:Transcript_35170/g.79410  ORF Transcript_35170/g.79410 Transcript_35170/m.79410 type:complete len:155 (+) Transcript_35170:35-499(+)
MTCLTNACLVDSRRGRTLPCGGIHTVESRGKRVSFGGVEIVRFTAVPTSSWDTGTGSLVQSFEEAVQKMLGLTGPDLNEEDDDKQVLCRISEQTEWRTNRSSCMPRACLNSRDQAIGLPERSSILQRRLKRPSISSDDDAAGSRPPSSLVMLGA